MATQDNKTTDEKEIKTPGLWGWHTYLSMGLTIAIFIVLALMVDLERVWYEFTNCNKMFLLFGMFAHYATYPVRGLRWRRCLVHIPNRGSRAKFGLLVFFYNFVDNMVPAKLGDVYGAHLAWINCGVARSAAMASIVFLRMMDAWIVLSLACVSSWVLFSTKLPPSVIWALIGGGIIALIATLIMLTFFLLKKALPSWVPERVRQMIQAVHQGMWPRPREILPIFVLTAIIWTLETLWMLLLVMAFGLKVGAAGTIFITMIPLLASAFPLTPSGAGAVELTLFSCLRVIGASSPLAASLTVMNRFIDYWLHIGLGLVVWAVRHKIGLNTWREVPLTASQEALPLKKLVRQKEFL